MFIQHVTLRRPVNKSVDVVIRRDAIISRQHDVDDENENNIFKISIR